MNAAIQLMVPVLAAVITGGCAAYVALQKHSAPGARAYTVVLLSQSVWSLGYVAELLATDVRGKLLWDDLQLPPPYLMTFGMLFFAFEYSGRQTRKLERWLWVLAALPAAACLWVFSDPIHGLARASARIEPDPPYGVLLYDFSRLELLSFVEVYLVGGYAAYCILKGAAKQILVHRRQALLVGGGIVLNLCAALPGVLGFRWLGQRDSSPFCFAISGLCVSWALTRYRLFDLVPIARHAVIEHLPDPVLVLDSKDRLMDLNPAARRLFGDAGFELGAVSSQTFPAWLDPGPAQTNSRPGARELSPPDAQAAYELNEAPLLGVRGELRGRALVLRDISERRRAQTSLEKAHGELERRVVERTLELETANASLRQQVEETRAARVSAQASEAQFRAIFDGAYELIGMLSPEGRLLEANRAALLLAGATSEEVRGQLFWETPWWSHSPELQRQLRAGIAQAARGEFVRMEVTHRAENGELRVLDFSLTPVFALNGQASSLVAEGRDISDRKRAEQENAQLQAQLYQAQKLDSIGRLAGGVAHDFNNLLTVIIGNVDLARIQAISPGVAEYLRDIEAASFSAASLTRQLLAFARRQIVEPRNVDLNESVSSVQKLLARLLGEDIELVLELEPELWRVRLDPSHAEQMLINLAVNARDAMPKGGRLTLRTENRVTKLPAHPDREQLAEYVIVSIVDEGIGIGAEVLPQIFEPFFTTKPLGLGTGLGLAMVYGAMQQAFGAVDVTSKVGSGSTFRLFFPRCTDESREALSHARAQSPPTGTELIALVEDQALVRATTQRQLESLGYRVMAFEGAAQALPCLLGERELSLLVTDVVLAGSSGRELAEQLSRSRPELSVLFISGYTEDVVLRQGVELGEVNFLSKPFDLSELARAVRRALDARPAPRSTRTQPLTTK
ncbi:MAG TPA: histidine kinase N-terminal 7TM domain-containing protein [Polyangiaceae bacterium]|nr:histidine kinase N-terminal 7TM domain-containing protein [Polyangiaceae bacterium]